MEEREKSIFLIHPEGEKVFRLVTVIATMLFIHGELL